MDPATIQRPSSSIEEDVHLPSCPSCEPKSLSTHVHHSCRLHSPSLLNHSSISSQSSESTTSSSSPLRKSASSPSRNLPIIVILLLLITSTFSILYVIEKVRDNKMNLLKLFNSKEAYSVEEEDDFTPSEVIIKTCTTLECIRAAEQISLIMDKTSNPCSDFYQFSCGKWKSNFKIPDDQSSYNTFSLMKDQLRISLRGLLETPIKSNDTETTIDLKNLYMSCMNERLIERKGIKPLIKLLKEDLIEWPLLSNGNLTINGSSSSSSSNTITVDEKDGESRKNTDEWVILLGKLRKYNNNILINIWIGADARNSSANTIHLDQPHLSLPNRDYYFNETTSAHLQAYHQFMKDVVKLLDPTNRIPDKVKEEKIEQMLDFEVKLANITVSSDEKRNDTNNHYMKMNLIALNDLFRGINWTLFFSHVFDPVQVDPQNDFIIIYSSNYYKKLIDLVHVTPKETVINYILWRFIANRINNLGRAFHDKQQDFHRVVHGTTSIPSRWIICTNYINKNLGMALGSLYVQQYFTDHSKRATKEMISHLKQSFLHLLDQNEWMDPDTKRTARTKVLLMREKIGYPDYILNQTALLQEFPIQLNFTRDDYFGNVIKMLKATAGKKLSLLGTSVDQDAWTTTPGVVNAFYTRSKNFISIPAGILQPPLYHPDLPDAINYGGIGVVIGHEITHGFDDKGRHFDPEGNLKSWWKLPTAIHFRNKSHCIENQYSNYVMKSVGLRINGKNTLGENIADNGGVKQAFKAYKRNQKRNALKNGSIVSYELPGINLTADQLFFMSFAQVWCGDMRREAIINAIRTGVHTPGKYRVIGSLSNSPEFTKAFNCDQKDPMNPSNKCSVW